MLPLLAALRSADGTDNAVATAIAVVASIVSSGFLCMGALRQCTDMDRNVATVIRRQLPKRRTNAPCGDAFARLKKRPPSTAPCDAIQ